MTKTKPLRITIQVINIIIFISILIFFQVISSPFLIGMLIILPSIENPIASFFGSLFIFLFSFASFIIPIKLMRWLD